MASAAGAQTFTGLGMSELGIAAQSIGNFLGAREANRANNLQRNLIFTGTGDPLTDPLLNALTFEVMLGLGNVNPQQIDSLLQQGSPLARARSQLFNQQPLSLSAANNLSEAYSALVSSPEFQQSGALPPSRFHGGSGGFLQKNQPFIRAASALGMSPEELALAEFEYQQSLPQARSELEAFAAQQAEQQALAESGVTGALQQLASPSLQFDALRAEERARLQREINDQADSARQDALRQANLLNTNPGRELGDLEESRLNLLQDADLGAIDRALGMISGLTTNEGNRLNALSTFLGLPVSQASNLAAVRAGAASSSPILQQTQPLPNIDPLGLALATSGLGYQQLGGSLLGSSGGLGGSIGGFSTGGTAPGTGSAGAGNSAGSITSLGGLIQT